MPPQHSSKWYCKVGAWSEIPHAVSVRKNTQVKNRFQVGSNGFTWFLHHQARRWKLYLIKRCLMNSSDVWRRHFGKPWPQVWNAWRGCHWGESMEPRLPDRNDWKTVFWVTAFKRISRVAKAAFLLSNADWLSFSHSSNFDEDKPESAVISIRSTTWLWKTLLMSHPNMEKLEDCLKYYLKVKRLKIVFLIPYAWTKLLLEESFEKL